VPKEGEAARQLHPGEQDFKKQGINLMEGWKEDLDLFLDGSAMT